MMTNIQRAPGMSRGRERAQSKNTRRAMVLGGTLLAAAAVGCADNPVRYFDGPSSIPNSTVGIQNAVTGFFSGMRLDAYNQVYWMAEYGRDIMYFISSAPVEITGPGGLSPVASGDFFFNDGWSNEYLQVRSANSILASLQTVTGYTPAQLAAVAGIVQTEKALDFMMLAEGRDTLGIPLYSMDGNPNDPPYCNMDVWKYIVALLDSAHADLVTAGNIPLPVTLPPGYAAVSQVTGPSTQLGSFDSFNRALAGKAGLEYAYAIARNAPGTHPTPTTPGSPDIGALTRADSALTASALYNPAVIAPPVAGQFEPNPYMVYNNYTGQSGDVQNQIFAAYFNYNALFDLQFDVDTANDLRWKAKFVQDPNAVQVAQYAGVSDGKNFLPYSSVSAPIPILRAEELALVRAQIQLGLGNLGAATTLINIVHQQAGGFATPLTIAPTYTAVRDSLLKEQRISTVFEMSSDRPISLRMYHLEAVADTTWQAHSGPDAVVDAALGGVTDYHTTVASIPVSELSARGGTYTLTCP